MLIAVVAPSSPLDPALPARVHALAQEFGARAPEVAFHPQCFLSSGHFAGDDAAREAAFVEVANDPRYDAVWFARGGYGACRIAEQALARLGPQAKRKRYLGYSDTAFILAGLYKFGVAEAAHGPMPSDLARPGGEGAVRRALAWLVDRDERALEAGCAGARKTAAFNITILSHLLGTTLEPDLSDHVLMLEDVSEYMYRIDRALFHIAASPGMRRLGGIRLGRCSDIPDNVPEFVLGEEQIARYWCEKAGIAYLGRADIGHDVDNKIVPFGSR